jgi:hypothetical protein
MNLAIEYIKRFDIVEKLIQFPLSIFVFNQHQKLAITINDRKNSLYYIVKHWDVSNCNANQDVPASLSHKVKKKELLHDPRVVLKDYFILKYEPDLIPSNKNTFRSPIEHQEYKSIFKNIFNSKKHSINREKWLWDEFVKIYIPSLKRLNDNSNYSTSYWQPSQQTYYSGNLNKQQKFLYSNFPELWGWWRKWKNKLIKSKITPGELVFMKFYKTL